jgi:hypothetical protein
VVNIACGFCAGLTLSRRGAQRHMKIPARPSERRSGVLQRSRTRVPASRPHRTRLEREDEPAGEKTVEGTAVGDHTGLRRTVPHRLRGDPANPGTQPGGTMENETIQARSVLAPPRDSTGGWNETREVRERDEQDPAHGRFAARHDRRQRRLLPDRRDMAAQHRDVCQAGLAGGPDLAQSVTEEPRCRSRASRPPTAR